MGSGSGAMGTSAADGEACREWMGDGRGLGGKEQAGKAGLLQGAMSEEAMAFGGELVPIDAEDGFKVTDSPNKATLELAVVPFNMTLVVGAASGAPSTAAMGHVPQDWVH